MVAPMDALAKTTTKPALEPLTLDLAAALGLIDKTFGIERILRDSGQDRVQVYYEQSRIGYDKVHSAEGCMHLAINEDGRFDPDGFLAQSRAIAAIIAETGARDVLEVGCGVGFNLRKLAEAHPDCRFAGVDLLADHVTRARRDAKGLENLHFTPGTFEPVPDDLGQFDVVFGIETLCYARDPDAVAASIARVLRPGGCFVIYDAHRVGDLADHPADMATAARLYEITTAVTNGFWSSGTWEAAMRRAGLEPQATTDLSVPILPGARVIHNRALRFFNDWKLRVAAKAMPTYLVRNAAAGLLGPYICFGPGPEPDPARGIIRYEHLIARKPAA